MSGTLGQWMPILLAQDVRLKTSPVGDWPFVGVSYAVHKVGLLGRVLSCTCPHKVQPMGRISALPNGRNSSCSPAPRRVALKASC
jgi:hypothetical protein